MTRFARLLIFVALGAGCALAQSAATQAGSAASAQLVAAAQHAFDEAVRLSRGDATGSQEQYRSAAGFYTRLVEQGCGNAAVEYNLGNIYHRLGEPGRAILHYRRAQLLDPSNAGIASNLAFVRKKVTPLVSPTGETRLLARLLFWNGYFSIHQRFLFAGIGLIGGWALLSLRLFVRRRPLAVAGLLAIVLGAANAASVGWQIAESRARPAVVVMQDKVVLCRERNDQANPVIRDPLNRGVEAVILGARGGWAEIALRDGTAGWVPLSAVERVESIAIGS